MIFTKNYTAILQRTLMIFIVSAGEIMKYCYLEYFRLRDSMLSSDQDRLTAE